MAQTKAQLVGGLGISTAQTLVVGSAATIHSGGFRIGSSDLHSTGISLTNVNASGIITAASFSGNTSSATYATTAGVSTYSTSAGIATYATTAGVSTYSTSAGIATYATTAGVSTNAQGLTGTPNIAVTNITGVAATFTGNVSIAGTLTYEDVTNVDSVGLITARAGVNVTGGSVVVGSAVTANSSGINIIGIVTATSFRGDGSQLTGVGGAAALTVLTSNTTLVKGTAYILNASGLVLTLPASPSTGDAIDILNNVVGIHTVARNGSTIKGLAEDMQVSQQGIKFKIWYTGSTWSLF